MNVLLDYTNFIAKNVVTALIYLFMQLHSTYSRLKI